MDPKSGNQDGFSSPSSLRKPKERDELGANAGRVWPTWTNARDDATSKRVEIKIRRENMLLVETVWSTMNRWTIDFFTVKKCFHGLPKRYFAR